MKPLHIFRHIECEGPAYLGEVLSRLSVPSRLIAIDRSDPVPAGIDDCSGLVFMGGPMSVNDPLPWVEPVCALLRDAVAAAVPVVGHCLGGQLLAGVLGAAVYRNPCKEMGWLPVDVVDPAMAEEWLGSTTTGELFHWHGDAFELPPGARRLLSSPLTPNQAFVVGRGAAEHLGMQFHIEMTPALVTAWARDPGAADEVAEERTRTGGPGVQSPEEMCRDVERRCEAMKMLAWRLYDRWARTLRR